MSKAFHGFVKLHRKLLSWGWYQDSVVKSVFLHLLLTANFKETAWQNLIIQSGQVVTGTQALADELGLSRQQIRTALKKLKNTGEITIKSTNKFSVITVVKWEEYQTFGETSTNELTDSQPTNNQQITNNQPQRKNDKKDKNDKNERELSLAPFGKYSNVFLSQEEADRLKEKYPCDFEAKLERLSAYQEINGKRYANHYATLLDWLEKDASPQNNQQLSARSYDIDELERIDTLDDFDFQ